MTILLCDIGGTHIRFALGQLQGTMSAPDKLLVDRHHSLEDAIARYLAAQSIDAVGISHFYLGYSHRNDWQHDEKAIRLILPNAKFFEVNDFEANAYGILTAPDEDFEILHAGSGEHVPGAAKVVLGVGTGLGLAYIHGYGATARVHKTHGGHMMPAILKDEHLAIFRGLQREDIATPIYEDVLSGRGLYNLYRFLCHSNHLDTEYHDTAGLLLSGRDNPLVQQALKIFHELLGVFAHHAVAFSYGYGGIYLTGGIIDRLVQAGLFDTQAFLEALRRPGVPVLNQHLAATPLRWVRDEFVSLRGLLNLARENPA